MLIDISRAVEQIFTKLLSVLQIMLSLAMPVGL
jgi:hypothetical protein